MKEIYSLKKVLLAEKDADLRYADLWYANLRETIIHSLGFDPRGYHFILHLEDTPYITAGCRKFSIEQSENHWKGTPSSIKVEFAKLLIESLRGKSNGLPSWATWSIV